MYFIVPTTTVLMLITTKSISHIFLIARKKRNPSNDNKRIGMIPHIVVLRLIFSLTMDFKAISTTTGKKSAAKISKIYLLLSVMANTLISLLTDNRNNSGSNLYNEKRNRNYAYYVTKCSALSIICIRQ